MARFSQRSRDNLNGVHPTLVAVLNRAIINTPVDFTVTEGVRETEEQKALYQIGRRGIKGERTVTDKDGVRRKSNHQRKGDNLGHAVDLYPYVGGKLRVTGPEVAGYLSTIALHIKAVAKEMGVKIIWGGDWKALDMPHFEL